jgi:hypothetical protein
MRDDIRVVAGPGTLTLADAREAAAAARAARGGKAPVVTDAMRERYLGYFGPRRSKSSAVPAKGKKKHSTKARSTKKR